MKVLVYPLMVDEDDGEVLVLLYSSYDERDKALKLRGWDGNDDNYDPEKHGREGDPVYLKINDRAKLTNEAQIKFGE